MTWWLRNTSAVADGATDETTPQSPRRGASRSADREQNQTRRQQEQTQAVLGPDGVPLKLYMAAGLGKQRLYVIPQHKLVVVRFAESTTAGQRFEDREFLGLLLGVINSDPAATPSTP